MNPTPNPSAIFNAALAQLKTILASFGLDAVATAAAVMFQRPSLLTESETEFNRVLKLLKRDIALRREDPTIHEGIEIYIEAGGHAGTGGRCIRSILRQFRKSITSRHGLGFRTSQLTKAILQIWRNEVTLRTLASESKRYHVAVVGMWLRFCAERNWTEGSFFPRQIRTSGSTGKVLPVCCWSLADCLVFLTRAILYRPDVVAALIVHLQTGLPFSTIVKLRRKDFDFDRLLLTVLGCDLPGGVGLSVVIRPSLEAWLYGMPPSQRICRLEERGLIKAFKLLRQAIGLASKQRCGQATYFSHLVASGLTREEAAKFLALEYAKELDRYYVKQPAAAGARYLNLLPPAGWQVPKSSWRPPRQTDEIEQLALDQKALFTNQAWQDFQDQAANQAT